MKFPATKNEQTEVKPAVKRLLDAYQWFWWSPPANAFGKSGISDIHAVRPGVFMVVETKYLGTSHGKKGPTALQLGFLNSIKAAQHFAFVVNDKNIDDFENFLKLFETAAQFQAKDLAVPAEVGAPMLDCINALMNYPAIEEPNL